MNEPMPDDLLDRYLSGRATPAERDRVRAWLAAEPSREALLEGLRGALGGEEEWDVDAAWARVLDRTAGDTADSAPRRVARVWVVPLRRAAVVAAVLAGGWLAWRALEAPAPPITFAAVTTAAAQRDTIDLPDGSRAILAPSSRLAPIALNDTVRAWDLDGEAFFAVEHEAARPFRVRANGAWTEVLGTEFTVRVRDDVTVAVREGRVSLSSAGHAITLAAGQVGRVTGDGQPALLDGDGGAWLAWLDGILEFDGAPLGEVAVELSIWFGREFVLSDSTLSTRRVSGRFVTTTPEQALEALSLTLGIPWAERDGGFVLGPTGGL